MTTAPPRQGDLRLLDTDVAKGLLAAPLSASLAFIALDATPRVVPVNFHWTGTELVIGGFAPSHKARALRANPAVAVTIDRFTDHPEALMLRGQATVSVVDGVVPEYALAMRRGLGDEQADTYLAHVAKNVEQMERIAIRPTWVGLLDFQTRFPAAMPTWLRG